MPALLHYCAKDLVTRLNSVGPHKGWSKKKHCGYLLICFSAAYMYAFYYVKELKRDKDSRLSDQPVDVNPEPTG